MRYFAIVALGGALGAMSRYWVYELVEKGHEYHFPWATLLVNSLGCLIAGFLVAMFFQRGLAGPSLRLLLMIGFLGAFTTFSSFAIESVHLMQGGHWWKAGLNIIANNVISLTLALVGMALANVI